MPGSRKGAGKQGKGKGKSGKGKGFDSRKQKTRSSRAGLQFPVGRIARYMKNGNFSQVCMIFFLYVHLHGLYMYI